MIKCFQVIVIIVFSLFLTSCDKSGHDLLKPPSYFNKLAKADLSAKGNSRNTQPGYFGSSQHRRGRVEKFPGVDQANFKKHSFRGAKKSGNGYELNFNNADLAELTKVILRDTLNLPYVYDPRVQGRVTLSTGGTVTKEELLVTLETILQMNNAALINGEKLYKVVPAVQARISNVINVNYADEQKAIGPGYGVSVLPLKHISADAMLNLLRSFTGKKGGVKTNFGSNILFVRGTGRERNAVISIARTFDVDWMRGQSAGIYVLKNASPSDLIPELRQIFKAKGPGKGVIQFRNIDRLNAVLALTRKAKLLDRVEKWIRRLDRTNFEAENVFVYRVENGKAKDLAEILNNIFGGGSSSSSTVRSAEENEVTPNQSASRIASNDDNDESEPKENSSSSSGSSQSFAASSSFNGSGNTKIGSVRITADEVNNKLLIKASGRDYRKVLKVLKRIDQPPLQVLINATLAEVTLNDDLQYGVQFFFQNNKPNQGSVGFSTSDALQIAANKFPGLNFLVGSNTEPKIVLDALATKTDVKVVSSPSVVVLHNQTASLQVGDEVPVAKRSVTDAEGNGSVTSNEIEFRNTGVILKVTPRVNSNGLVTMEISQEISNVSNSIAAGDSGTLTPTISQRKIDSTIAVNSGQMVVLGGLISERTNITDSGIPGLRKVPILGKFIGADNDRSKARTELVVFLQPTVIRDAKDAADIAQSVRDGLLSLAPEKALKDHYGNVAEKSFK